eukprot:m.308991 g.308991  ORF g.308991 m.308991 type:complete len:558 (+) comp16473_c0_seq28:159-1832(+)
MSQLLLLLLPVVWEIVSSAPVRPHVVLFFGDDVGTSDIGYGNSNGTTQPLTPTIDSLAQQGVRLSAHYVFNWCAPSRGMLMTGRYVLHYGSTGGGGMGNMNGLPLNFTLLPEALNKAGYNSSFIGKWHLGDNRMALTPFARGFSTALGYLSGQTDYYTKGGVRASWPDSNTSAKECYGADWWHDDHPGFDISEWNQTYSLYIYTQRAVQIVNEQASANKKDPSSRLFMYFATQNIHDPHQVPQRFVDLYTPTKDCPAGNSTQNEAALREEAGCACCGRRVLMAMASALDEAIANVTAALKTNGLWNNTLLLFASDNGGNVADDGSNFPLRGGKFSNWEGGVRSPAFLAGPLIPQAARGKWYNGIFSVTDWSATICELAGLNPEAAMAAKPMYQPVPDLDGMPMWDAVMNMNMTARSEVYITQGIMRIGEYKIIVNNPGGRGLIGTGGGWIRPATNMTDPYPNRNTVQGPIDEFLLRGCNKSDPCLFHVGGEALPWDNDAREANNLATEMPELLASMLKRLDAMEATKWTPPTPPENTGKCCDTMFEKYNGLIFGPWQ